MRFERIRLQNFKPYADADLSLEDGVTVVHGPNGSGKSSLLEACFFALYGAKALDETLDDVITNGEEDAEIELWFVHDGEQYRIERHLKRYDDRAQTTKCVLETPEGTIDGAGDVRQHVSRNLLRMDADAFVNCAYVRQGEVNKLINATPSQRQDMIDDLLQLGRLEEYRDRAGDARLAVEDILHGKRELLENTQAKIEEKEETNPHGRLNELGTELNEVDDAIERYEDQKAEAEETLAEAEDVLETYEEKRDRLDELDAEIDDLEATIAETEERRDALREQIAEERERVDEVEDDVEERVEATELPAATEDAVEERLAELDEREESLTEARNEAQMAAQAFENQSSNLAERADDLAERAEAKREQAADLDGEADDTEEALSDRRDRLDELDAEIEELRAEFDDAPVSFGEASSYREECRAELESLREREGELSTEYETLSREVEKAERLLDAGKCPECGQPVEDSPHVDTLDADKAELAELDAELDAVREDIDAAEADLETAERLVEVETEVETRRTRRENVEELLAEKEKAVAEKREQAESLREEADELTDEAEAKREVAEEKTQQAAEKREEVAQLDEKLTAVQDARSRVETIRDLNADIEDRRGEIDRLRERRENLSVVNDERRDRLTEKRKRRDELREAVEDDAIERARERKENAEAYLERVEGELADHRERRDELQNAIGGVQQDIRQLEELREDRDRVAERVDALESLHDEASALESLYGDLRAELRQRNVQSLERMLNETFDLVYENDAYSRIDLDGEYELTVYQKDGQALEPEQLSGGERALFNLSLRTAIYRLLAEGIEGTAPMPPLILDEPTVFLDSGHVSRLVDLVQEMGDLGVRQTVIVSHHDELIGAADQLVTVEKDPTTNRSQVTRRAGLLEAAD